MPRIKIEIDRLVDVLPEVEGLRFLPRKKKKALKKKLAKMIIEAMTHYSNILLSEEMFNEIKDLNDEILAVKDNLENC